MSTGRRGFSTHGAQVAGRRRTMMLLAVFLLVLAFFALIFYALLRKGYVRATLKGPLAAILFEFEAHDRKRDFKR